MSKIIKYEKTLLLFSLVVILLSSVSINQSFAGQLIPDWVKNNFVWYADELISESELLNAIKFLIENQIIIIDSESEEIPERSSFAIGGATYRAIEPKVDYTILVYVVGSDLESRYKLATADFKEMVQGNPSDSVNVIIESGGAKAKPDGERTIDFTTVKRLKITGDGVKELSDLGKKNMGESDTLSDFLVWGTTSYPAEKYVLILWNHGNGINGYGLDEIYRDHLNLDELEEAFSTAKKRNDVHYELIGFDACLMATLEVANVLKDYSNYMVASEEFEVGDGWEYTTIISSLNNDSKQSGNELGKVIADAFFADTKAKSRPGQDLNRITTLSVIDLSKISAVNDSVNSLTSNIENSISVEDMPKFSVSLGKSERYGTVTKGKDSGHMDIKHFSEKITEILPQFKEAAEKVKASVESAVTYKVNGASKPHANGLSIYMPRTSDAVSTTYRYGDVSSANQFYSEYLEQDKTPPPQNLQFDGTVISGTYEGEDVYEIIVYWTTTVPSNTDLGLVDIIATDEFDPNDFEWGFTKGNIQYDWDKFLPMICNSKMCHPVSPEWEWGDTADLAYIQAVLVRGDDRFDVDLLFDITVEDDEVFIGAYPHATEGVFEKNLLSPQEGDTILLVNTMLHWESDQYLFLVDEKNPLPVDDGFRFQWIRVYDLFYMIVEICDYSGNCSYSDWFEYDSREGI